MMSATLARPATEQRSGQRGPRGLTLLELLAVMVILVILTTITLGAVLRANRTARRVRVAADLQAISVALNAYRDDMGDYPRVVNEDLNGNGTLDAGEDRNGNGLLDVDQGSRILCRALLAPGPEAPPTNGTVATSGYDGADGPGFRLSPAGSGADGNWATTSDNLRAVGRVYGPYLAPEKFKITGSDATAEILDSFGGVILYYPAFDPSPNIRTSVGFVAGTANTATQQALFDSRHNLLTRLSTASMRRALGDANANGIIDAAEVPAVTGAILLWTAGPDGLFGNSDDVTNIGEQ